jgi:hypothetical protein
VEIYTKFRGLSPDLKGMRSYRREESLVTEGHNEIFSHDISIICCGFKELAEIITLSIKKGDGSI